MFPASCRLLSDSKIELLDLGSVNHDNPGLLRVRGIDKHLLCHDVLAREPRGATEPCRSGMGRVERLRSLNSTLRDGRHGARSARGGCPVTSRLDCPWPKHRVCLRPRMNKHRRPNLPPRGRFRVDRTRFASRHPSDLQPLSRRYWRGDPSECRETDRTGGNAGYVTLRGADAKWQWQFASPSRARAVSRGGKRAFSGRKKPGFVLPSSVGKTAAGSEVIPPAQPVFRHLLVQGPPAAGTARPSPPRSIPCGGASCCR